MVKLEVAYMTSVKLISNLSVIFKMHKLCYVVSE